MIEIKNIVIQILIVHTSNTKCLRWLTRYDPNENLKLAQRGAYLSLVVYIVLSVAKYITGYVYDSAV